MTKRKQIVCALLLISSFSVLWTASPATGLVVFDSTSLLVAGKVVRLEIANTANQRQQGLMFRANLEDQAGMIFIYPHPGNHRIWMKNTRIPLTVIWFDENATVIDVKKLKPCKQASCPSFGVQSPSRYIIEFNDKFNDLKPGDRLPGILSLE